MIPVRTKRELPDRRDVRFLRWVGFGMLGLAGGAAFAGWRWKRHERGPAERGANALMAGSAATWAATFALDAAEHLRLEKEQTGTHFAMHAITPGETLSHVVTLGTLAATMALARPLPRERMELRDWIAILGPGVVMALGVREEIQFHRRRAKHREEMIHAISHLGLAGMLVGVFAARVIPWKRVSSVPSRAARDASPEAGRDSPLREDSRRSHR
jgi:hypothetical protein